MRLWPPSVWPRSLGLRLLVAVAFAVVAIIVLAVLVERFEVGPKPTRRAKPVATNPLRDPALVQGRGRARVEGKLLGFPLLPVDGTIVLARSQSALAPDIAPVIEILADGGLVLRRPAPLAAGPAARPRQSQGGHGAGVVLPAENLDSLSPAVRAALIGLLQQWVVERPIRPGRLRASGFVSTVSAVRTLLSWVP